MTEIQLKTLKFQNDENIYIIPSKVSDLDWDLTVEDISAAPAGFGLGTYGKKLSTSDDLNNIYHSGFYRWDYAPINAPYNNGIMLVLSNYKERLAQVVWITENNKFLYRTTQNNSIWTAWADCSPSAFAPAGFGLGETVKWIYAPEKLADYIHSGFYSWASGVSDAPFAAGSMIVIKRSEQYIYQVAFRDDVTRTEMVVRKLTNTTWTPWEWINPPMEAGVEYRTTERYNGKAVYVKSVSIGKLTNGTNVKITGVSEAGAVRAMAKAGGYTAPFYSNATLIFGYSLGPTTGGVNVGLYSNGTLDALNVTVTIWYTKD